MKFTALLFLVLSRPVQHSDWHLVKDKDGIRLYTRTVEGSSLKAIKAQTTFAAPLEACVAVLRDIHHLNELFPDCRRVEKVIQRDNEQIHYLQLDAPWPVTDRDGAFRLEYAFDPARQTVTVTASMSPDSYPLQKDFVRLSAGGGTWRFTRLENGHTALEYHYHGEPGGSIPAWLANAVVEENPYRMLLNFHRLVIMDRYQGKHFSFMQEP